MPSLEGVHTYAPTLPELDHAVREVVALATNCVDADLPRIRLDHRNVLDRQ